MLFNSLDFAIFLPLVFLVYWFILKDSLKKQNIFIVLASYTFYGWWDWRFLFLIIFSTIVDYFIGLKLSNEHNDQKRKKLLWLSIVVNLGFLGYFKYSNFFIENFIEAFTILGYKINYTSINIVLPVGISFYTFQTMSYTIDVYRKNLKTCTSFIDFAAFVSFFPQLVAGPIERASNLLPQFYTKRKFDYLKAVDGLRQILWGLFKKIVIADNCAQFANEIFDNYEMYNASTLFLGALFFSFQIYGDFSGYSDIAIGTSRLFGFDLKKNFSFPYFSRSIAEFWRRWHISLSSWFKDYLYIPLGGSKGNTLNKIRNTFIIFIVSGFWHGANWTFVIWGTLNAIYFLPSLILKSNRKHIDIVAKNRFLPSLKELINITSTFLLVLIAWIFFRSESIFIAFNYIRNLFNLSLFSKPNIKDIYGIVTVLFLLCLFIFIEWTGRENEFAIAKTGFTWPRAIRWVFYCCIIFFIGMFIQTKETPFIYFQF